MIITYKFFNIYVLFQCCSWMSTEIPVLGKKWFFNKKYDAATLETLRCSLQEYLSVSHLRYLF